MVVSAPLMQDSFFKGKIWTDVSARLNELRCEHAQPNNAPPATKGCFDKIIHFNRRHTKDWDAKARYWVPRRPEEYTTEEESTVLLFMSGQEVEAAVGRRKAGRSDGTLVDIITKVKQSHGYHYQVFVLVQNLQQKAKVRAKQTKERWDAVAAGTSAAQSQPKGKGKDQGWDPSISFEEVQQELVTLTVAERCFVLRAETPSEAIDWLVDITKDLAYKPYKCVPLPADCENPRGLSGNRTEIERFSSLQADRARQRGPAQHRRQDRVHQRRQPADNLHQPTGLHSRRDDADCACDRCEIPELEEAAGRLQGLPNGI